MWKSWLGLEILLLTNQFFNENSFVCDVHASVGRFSIGALMRKVRRLLANEKDRKAVEIFAANIALNRVGFSENFETYCLLAIHLMPF